MKNQYSKQPSSRKLLKTLLESTPENLCYDEVHETLSKVVRLKYQPTKSLNLLELDIGARCCWCSLATFVESFGSRGLSHCSPDHQSEELLLSLKLVEISNPLKNLTLKPGEDMEGVRTRAAAMLRAKHKINKLTIQVNH